MINYKTKYLKYKTKFIELKGNLNLENPSLENTSLELYNKKLNNCYKIENDNKDYLFMYCESEESKKKRTDEQFYKNSILEAKDAGVNILIDIETEIYIKSNLEGWLYKTTWPKDDEFMEIIFVLQKKGLTDKKVIICVGESFFMYLSFFFSNSTFKFVDVNFILLKNMKLCIEELKDVIKPEDSYEIILDKLIATIKKYNFNVDNINNLLKQKLFTKEYLIKMRDNLFNNEFQFYASSIASSLFFDVIEPFIYKIDYINISNLIIHSFGNKIPNFWEFLKKIKLLNQNILYIGTQGPPKHGFVFNYNNEIQSNNDILYFVFKSYEDFVQNVLPILKSKEWIKYALVEMNTLYYYEKGDQILLNKGEFGNRALIDRL